MRHWGPLMKGPRDRVVFAVFQVHLATPQRLFDIALEVPGKCLNMTTKPGLSS